MSADLMIPSELLKAHVPGATEVVNGSAMFRALVETSVKAAVLVALVLAVQWIFRSHLAPVWRHALWILVVLRLLVPVSAQSSLSIFNLAQLPNWTRPEPKVEYVVSRVPMPRTSMSETMPRMRVATSFPVRRTPANLPLYLFTAWLAGALLLAGRSLISTLRLRSRLSGETPSTNPRLLSILESCKKTVGIRRTVAVIETEIVSTPALAGVLHPKLLLPARLTSSFDENEIRFIMLHELAHLRRHDVAFNWLTSVLQTIHWFNPLIWIAFTRMKDDRELACDALALSFIERDEDRQYGETVIKLLELFGRPQTTPVFVGMASRRQQIKRRIRMIANYRKPARYSLLALGVTGLLGWVSLTDARAQDPAPEPKKIRTMVMRNGDGPLLRMGNRSPEVRAALEALTQKISFESTQASLNDVLSTFSAKTGTTVTVDSSIASEAGELPNATVKASEVKAGVVLDHFVGAMGLDLKVEGSNLVVIKGTGNSRFADLTSGDGKLVIEQRIVTKDVSEGSNAEVKKEIFIDRDGERIVVKGDKIHGDLVIVDGKRLHDIEKMIGTGEKISGDSVIVDGKMRHDIEKITVDGENNITTDGKTRRVFVSEHVGTGTGGERTRKVIVVPGEGELPKEIAEKIVAAKAAGGDVMILRGSPGAHLNINSTDGTGAGRLEIRIHKD